MREHDGVGVDDEAGRHARPFEHLELLALRDHDAGGVRVGDVRRDPRHRQVRVQACGGCVGLVDQVRDEAAVPIEAVADDGDRRVVAAAADVEGVAALVADELERHRRAGALHVEGVVAGAAVDDDLLDPRERDVQARAEDAAVGDHERVAEVGSDDDDRVEAVAAVDPHRRVDGVVDEVGSGAAVDVRERRLRVVRVHLDEGADRERVVAVLAVQPQLGQVVVHREGVVAVPAVQRCRLADAVRQETGRRLGGREVVVGREPVARVRAVTRGREQLADDVGVVAVVAEDRGRNQVVVEHERVVAGAAVDRQPAVDRAVVVDPLHRRGRDGLAGRIHRVGGDHALPEREVRAQEVVRGRVGAVDRELVQVAGVHSVLNRDRRAGLAGQPDLIQVAAGPALEAQRGGDAVLERLVAELVVVDADQIAAVAALDDSRAGNRPDVDRRVEVVERRGLVASVEVEGAAGRRRVDEEVVLAVAQPDVDVLEVRVRDSDQHPEPGEPRRG